jgi:cytochrome c-type biogenesis protein CcmE
MKKLHIIGIIVIAVAVGIIFTQLRNTSTYADFAEAASHPDKEFHVVGKLDKTKPQVYEPRIDPDMFTFSMTDSKGATRDVVLHKSKPQDFEKSEQIVLIGKMDNDVFHANDILMKCPSKYNEPAASLN